MSFKKYPPTKDRRDIGQVVFPIEKMLEVREFSSCCVSTEAYLETNSGFSGLIKQIRDAGKIQKD